jgi:hypothetical protein
MEHLPKTGKQSRSIQKKIAQVGAYSCDAQTLSALKGAMANHFEIGKTEFDGMVKEAKKKGAQERNKVKGNDEDRAVVDLGQQVDVWTRQVIEAVSKELVTVAGSPCAVENGALVHYSTPASITTFVDSPSKVLFIRESRNGQTQVSPQRWEAELVLSALRSSSEIEEVKVTANHPTLLFRPGGTGDDATELIDHGDLRDGVLVLGKPKEGNELSVKDVLHKRDL